MSKEKTATTEPCPLLPAAVIRQKVESLGARLSKIYANKNPLLVCMLKGACFFLADLARAMDIPLEIDFMRCASYGARTVTSGQVKILQPLTRDITDRHVIIVEDIIDSGVTLSGVLPLLEKRRPASLAVCALLDKPTRRQAFVPVQYRGFVIPDVFVVGYGLDYDERYRNLPYIGMLRPSEKEKETE